MSAGAAFQPGSLVRARGREWVVLPESDGDLLVLRPLTGGEEAFVYLPLESIPGGYPIKKKGKQYTSSSPALRGLYEIELIQIVQR